MAWSAASKRKSAHRSLVWRAADVLSLALMGLSLGIVVTFWRRAFHGPLVFLAVAAFVGGCFVAWLFRERRPLS